MIYYTIIPLSVTVHTFTFFLFILLFIDINFHNFILKYTLLSPITFYGKIYYYKIYYYAKTIIKMDCF